MTTATEASIVPMGDKLVVRPLEREEITKSGLVLPDTAKEKPQEGEVVAVGPGRMTDEGKRIAMELKKGDHVIYAKYAGTEVKLEEEEFLINDYVADSVRDHPDRLTGVCIVDMQSVEAEYRLSYWVEEQGMRGVRLYATNDPQDTWLDAPRTFGVWVRAELLDIPVCVQTFTHHLPKLRAMLERYPNVRVALDHLADYHGEANGHEAAAQALLPLAELPRLYLKFSAANLLAFRAAGADTKGIFDMLLEHFGPQRLIWGSNFPATYTQPYEALVDFSKKELAFLDE